MRRVVAFNKQVPVNGNALFSAVSASEDYFATGEHPSVEPKAIELKAKELRKVSASFLSAYFSIHTRQRRT